MFRKIWTAILLITFCALQNSIMADTAQKEPSAKELERIAEEIAKDISEGRLKLVKKKMNEMRKNLNDEAKEKLEKLIKDKLKNKIQLSGIAEGLWGKKIDLSIVSHFSNFASHRRKKPLASWRRRHD